jgi:hypothetical protein
MALQLSVHYQNLPVTYNVVMQEDNIYHLKLNDNTRNHINGNYIPEKIVIRKKGKIWISDMDNYDELIDALTREITSFTVNPE